MNLRSLLEGDRRAVARALSAVEQGDGRALAQALRPHLGRAHVVGVTGPPGAGKSTLVHALLGELLGRGHKLGVVAVDPSSPITQGAVLGDRVRMGKHGAHPNVFIRSVASRGHAGGLSRSTSALVDVLDAAGFDTVIVETVGAGQSEVEIMGVADTRVVVCPPGAGDEVQAMKAGILEIADVLVVTKADLPGADAMVRDLRDMLRLRHANVPVVPVSALNGPAIPQLADAILAHDQRGRRIAASPTTPDLAALAEADPYMQALGMRFTEGGAGRATVALTLAPQHLNFNGGCHGGLIFSVADAAFGLASNSHGPRAAGIDAHCTFQHAARLGDVLVARARETSRSRRLAFYQVEVTTEANALIATFTGTVSIAPSGEKGSPP